MSESHDEMVARVKAIKDEDRRKRANTIYIGTTYSQDGRSLEGFYLPKLEDSFQMFLMMYVLQNSPCFQHFTDYDAEGNYVNTTYGKRELEMSKQPENIYPLTNQAAPLRGNDVTEILDYLRRNGVPYLRMAWVDFLNLYKKKRESVSECELRVAAELKSVEVMSSFGKHSVFFCLDYNWAPAEFKVDENANCRG